MKPCLLVYSGVFETNIKQIRTNTVISLEAGKKGRKYLRATVKSYIIKENGEEGDTYQSGTFKNTIVYYFILNYLKILNMFYFIPFPGK